MESVDGRTVAQPSAPTVYVKQDVVGAWIIIDIQLYVSPPAGMVNVDVRETSLIWFVCWTVGWWEVFYSKSSQSRV